MSSKKAKDPYDYKYLKKTISGWEEEAESSRRKSLSATRARLSASGVKPGTTYWNKQMSQVEEAYQSNLADIRDTETFRQVRRAEKDYAAKEASIEQGRLADKALADFHSFTGMSAKDLAEAGVDIHSASSIEEYQQEFFGGMGLVGDNTPNKIWWEGGFI